MLRIVGRVTLLIVVVGGFMLGSNSQRSLAAITVRTSRCSRWVVRILGIRSRRFGVREPTLGQRQPGRLIVANHISWIDPLLLAAEGPHVFVTSMDVAADSLLGRLCRGAGCLFIDRRRSTRLIATCQEIQRQVQVHQVVVFPEATSSDGTSIMPFRPACFSAAVAHLTPVVPRALRYRQVVNAYGSIIDPRRVSWWGDQWFLPHLWSVITMRSSVADWHCLPAMIADDRRQLALATRQGIVQALSGVQTAKMALPYNGDVLKSDVLKSDVLKSDVLKVDSYRIDSHYANHQQVA